MISRVALIGMVVAVVIAFEGSQATPVIREKVHTALQKVEADLDSLEVPDLIKKIAEGLRKHQLSNPEANPNFTNYVRGIQEDGSVEHIMPDILRALSIEELCSDYVDNLMSFLKGSEMGDELIDHLDKDYAGYIQGHDKLDEKIGYGEVCAATYGSY